MTPSFMTKTVKTTLLITLILTTIVAAVTIQEIRAVDKYIEKHDDATGYLDPRHYDSCSEWEETRCDAWKSDPNDPFYHYEKCVVARCYICGREKNESLTTILNNCELDNLTK